MASALTPGASAAIKYSIAILGRGPSEAELAAFSAAYAGPSTIDSEDAVALAVVNSKAGIEALRPGIFSATQQARVILLNHGVTDSNAIAFVAGYIDGTAGAKLPLNVVVRAVVNLVSTWTSTPANAYNDVLMSAKSTLSSAVTTTETNVISGKFGISTEPTYTLTADSSVDEGKSFIATLVTKNVASGSVVNYIISGVDATDVSQLTGSATVGSDGKAYIQVSALADGLTEGEETMTIAVGTATTKVKINDKSISPPVNKDLTTGIDTTIVGGALDDVFKATSAQLNAGDVLSGGDGADRLEIVSASATATPVAVGTGVTSTGIETISITASPAGAGFTLDATGFTGVTKVVNTGSTADVSVVGLRAIPSVEVSGTSTNTTLGFSSATVTAGAADEISIAVNGAATVAPATITANGIETIKVATTGSATGSSANTLSIASNAATTLNVTGSVAAWLAVNLAGATASTVGTVTSDDGAHDIAITADATDKLSVSLGAGNDALRIANIAATHTLAGGAGTDTLVTSAAITTVTGANISEFEAVEIRGGVSVALPLTANPVAALTIRDAAGGTLTGLASGGTVTLSTGGNATVTNTAWTAGTTDSLVVNVGSATASAAMAAATLVTAQGIESATINNLALPNNASARSVGVASATLTKMVVTGGAATTVTGGGVALTEIDASAVQGAVTFAATVSTTAGLKLSGGAGADAITGGNFADVLVGGAGNDTITGGTGVDTLTGGEGADTFVFGVNVNGAVPTSSAASPDVITDFVSGTDKLQIAQGPSKFLNTYSSYAAANAAALADGTANLAFFVSAENTLYVQALPGVLAATDTVIKLDSVTAVTGADLLLGSQGTTGGASVALTSAGANVSTTSMTNASASTTNFNDTITSSAAFLVMSAIDGGAGSDSLTISTELPATNLSTSITSVETITFAAGTNGLVTMPATRGLSVVNGGGTNGTSAATVLLGAGTALPQSFNGSASSGVNTVTLGAAQQSVTGGAGADVFTATNAQALGSSFSGGGTAGTTDTLNITGGNVTLLSTAPVIGVSGQIAGIEQINIDPVATLTVTPDQALSVGLNAAGGGFTVVGTGSTITVGAGVSGAAPTSSVTLQGSSSYKVDAAVTSVVRSAPPAGAAASTLEVTTGASGSVTSAVTTTVNAAALTGTLTVGGVGVFTVTGLGSAAGGVVTEASGMTGALNVTTAGTNASTVIQSTGTGAFVLTSGAGSVALTATASHTSETINLNGIGAVTVQAASTATAYTINVGGTAGNRTYVNASTSVSVDTYTGGTGADDVTLGLGGDIFVGGGGADTFRLAPTTDTGLALGFLASTAVPANGTVMNVAGLDKVTGFGTGVRIVLNGLTETGGYARNGQTMGGLGATAGSLDSAMVTGTYDPALNTFTVSLAGTSTLYVYDDNGDTAGGNLRGIVLVGYVDASGNDSNSDGTVTGLIGVAG